MRHAAALTALLLAGTAVAQGRGEPDMRAAILAAHNSAREAYGSKPLVWDETLAADAARHARTLSARGEMEHDPQHGARIRQGENLFMGTRGAFSYAAMAKLWVDEGRWFRKGVFPDVTTAGDWSRVGHYTQVVWPQTQRVGCATASNGADEVLVCRYLPAGNYVGVELR